MFKRIGIGIIVGAFWLAGAGATQAAGLPVMETSIIAQPAPGAFTIDGNAADWSAVAASHTDLRGNSTFESSTYPTTFKVSYDQDALYVLVTADGQAPDTITAERAADDASWWNDDVVELFLYVPGHQQAVHLGVNPKGVAFYTEAGADYVKQHVKSAAVIDGANKRFTVEIRAEFDGNVLPKPGPWSVWGLKVGREIQKSQDFSIWPIGGDFWGTGNAGVLIFGQ